MTGGRGYAGSTRWAGYATRPMPEVLAEIEKVAAAAKAAGKAFAMFVPDVAKARDWRRFGFSMFFVASEHAWMLAGARAAASGIKALAEEA